MGPGPRSPFSAARVVYAGILTSTVIVSVGALVVGRTLHPLTTSIGPVDGIALLAGLAAFGAAQVARGRLPPGGERSDDAWWVHNGGRAVLLWGLLELSAIPGAIALFASGRLTGFAVLAVMALAGLVVSSPARLAGG